MTNFDIAIPVILKHEGGLVNNPNDPGGVTNYGISLRWALDQMRKSGVTEFDVDGDGDLDATDIIKLPEVRAIDLYRRYFWDKRYDQLSPAVATKVFDMAVNMGPVRAHALAANAATAITPQIDDFENSDLGLVFSVLGTRRDDVVLPALRCAQWGWYDLLINRNAALLRRSIQVPDFSVFRKGWRRRAFS